MIATHRYEPGLRLNVEKITRELKVSRTPVWEAIRRLEQEGILSNIPNRGVFFNEIPLEKSYEIHEVRGALDKLAVRLACEWIDDPILDRLNQCLPDQLRAIETDDLPLWSSSNLKFHCIIYEAARNAVLSEAYESVVLRALPARLEILPVLPSLYKDHKKIIEALAGRDPDRAEAEIISHTETMLNHIKNLFIRRARMDSRHVRPGSH
jgi:DNA-binding GntR family transcriptional regulator